MKKKLAFVLSLCFIMLALSACGTDPATVDYNGISYDDLQSYSENMVSALAGYSDTDLDSMISGGNLDDKTVDLVQKWKDTLTDVGTYEGLGDFSVDKSGKTLTTDLVVRFEKRNVDFQVVINYNDMQITGYSLEPVYSVGEKMEKAGLNTIISMSIVFCVLILISLIIYCFKIFPYLKQRKLENRRAQIAEKQTETHTEPAEEPALEEELTDDLELVAVIAAAIAADTGMSTSDFVVRSINRR